jgi:predicted dehydrogenase
MSEQHGSPVGVAVVGFGYWGPNVARNFATSKSTELRLVCDRDESARERAETIHPLVRTTSDWDELLGDESVEAVAIALPVPLHHRFAMEALAAGKHVLVEKPLAQSIAECRELVDEAARRERVLMVGHTFEYNAAVEAIRGYLERGELGEPYYIAMQRTNLGIVRRDENAMWSLAPHDISILCRWLGRQPVSVNATGVAHLQPGVHDVVFITIEFEGGVLGHVHCSWLHPHKVRQATIVGSRKMALYDDVSADEKVRLYDKGIVRQALEHPSLGRYQDFARFQMLARAGDVLIPKIEFAEPLAAQVTHFAECIRDGTEPRTGGESGARVVAVLEAAQRSLEGEGQAEPVEALRVVQPGAAS